MSLLTVKVRKKYSVFPIKHFVYGIKKVGLVLLDCHQEHEDTILRTLKTLLAALLLLYKKGKYVTVECPPQNKVMTLNDKKLFLDKNTLTTTWLQTSALGLIGREKVYEPFWSKQCEDISQRLWLPIETGSVGSHSTFWNGSSSNLESHSWFTIKRRVNPQITNYPTTYSPSYMSIHVEEWEKEDIQRTRKTRFYPTMYQRTILKRWMGGRRFVYNKVLAKIKFEGEKINAFSLRDKYVTNETREGVKNPNVEDWQRNIPSDIREEAIRDLCKNFKTAFSNLKNRNISAFKINFCRKKDSPSIAIPLQGIKATNKIIDRTTNELEKIKTEKKQLTRKQVEITKKDGGFYLYPTLLTGKLKIKKRQLRNNIIIDGTCRIKVENNAWYLISPYRTTSNIEGDTLNRRDYCALDPGVRTFQTIYSEQEVTQIKIRKELVAKLLVKLDTLNSLRSKKIIKGNKNHRRVQRRLNNLIDDLHHKTANYITKNYNTIYLPPFETQKMTERSNNSNLNRNMLQLKHYKFKQRLEAKCHLRKCRLGIYTEEFTSKTCGRCGVLNDVGSDEVYHCSVCGLYIDRDVNGARNIMIKTFNTLNY